ncbi:hypothetical protein TSAR_012765 [Trichomalopsis sarcophagae]|uniref:DNA-directed DNA polymerase n=1 Tax=Trichomalopsis sarcophagae TaxID=543379 RepID=A0A232EXI7_9HYME|nr:hypothetical protein TSAR_012765 [Trichomalopsis sarcophagae]
MTVLIRMWKGYPPDCITEEDKERYVKELRHYEGISLNKHDSNSVSILCGESLVNVEVNGILPVNDDTLYVNWCYRDEALTSSIASSMTNVVLAAFTTTQARLKLFDYLHALGPRVFYYDTDLVFYVCKGETIDLETLNKIASGGYLPTKKVAGMEVDYHHMVYHDKYSKAVDVKLASGFYKKDAAILKALFHLNNNQQKALLQTAASKLVRHIFECTLNLPISNVPLEKSHKSRLRRHAKTLRKLSEPCVSLLKKKKIIVQRGCFLPALLAPIIITLLASIISNVMTRLDAEISNILNSSTCKSELEKWSQYLSVLQRYHQFKDVDSYAKVMKKK